MIERFLHKVPPPADRLKLRIEALDPNVRAYLAIGVSLDNVTLTNEEQSSIRKQHLDLLSGFNDLQRADLYNFLEFKSTLRL